MKIDEFRKNGLTVLLRPAIIAIKISGNFLFFEKQSQKGFAKFWKNILGGAFSLLQFVVMIVHTSFCLTDAVLKRSNFRKSISSLMPTLYAVGGFYKLFYVAVRRKNFYKTLRSWTAGLESHPLLEDLEDRTTENSYKACKKITLVGIGLVYVNCFLWSIKPFFFMETVLVEQGNTTIAVPKKQLIMDSWYPWDISYTPNFVGTYIFQVFWVWSCCTHTTSFDMLLCEMMYHLCLQLRLLKSLVKPFVLLDSDELSDEMETDIQRSVKDKIAAIDEKMKTYQLEEKIKPEDEENYIESALNDLVIQFGKYRKNLTSAERNSLVQSLIKYWVERHRCILRFADAVQESYGLAVMVHMQIATISLSLLAYETSMEKEFNMYSLSIVGYLIHVLGEVVVFCVFGDKLLQESFSMLRVVYDSSWYHTSRNFRIFISLVCQQCQRPLVVTGHMFFTLSHEFLASLLSVVITYYLFLIQLA